MPEPNPSSETESEWMARCIPFLEDEGKPHDQAVAQYLNMWAQATKGESFKGVIFKKE